MVLGRRKKKERNVSQLVSSWVDGMLKSDID